MIITLDPGLNGCGLAVGDLPDRQPELRRAWYAASSAKGSPAQRGIATGIHAAAVALDTAVMYPMRKVVVAVEMMQVYPRGKRVNPKWLLALAACAGAFAAAIEAHCDLSGAQFELLTPQPREWKGTLDGDRMIERIKRELLRSKELHLCEMPSAEKTLGHNVYDAAGLYLWAAGRLKKERVIHR